MQIGDTLGYITKDFKLETYEINKIKRTDEGFTIKARGFKDKLDYRTVKANTDLLDSFDDDDSVLIEEPFVLTETNIVRIVNWCNWAQTHPETAKTLFD